MFQTKHRACSGYLVRLGGVSLWLDAGAGTWRNLLDQINYEDLDGVLLTHRHPDHVTDVFQACHARLYGPQGEQPKIPLWAPRETADAVCSFAGSIEDAFEVRIISSRASVEWAGATLRFFDMAHPPETLGVRIEYEGAVFAYSADTGPKSDLIGLAQDADVFICEATLQEADGEWEGHLHAAAAASVAKRAGVKHLVLSHLPPGRDLTASIAEAQREAGDVTLELAEEGRTLEVQR
jgi:ribonuclease BN (tRNA processing enzyme)